MLSLLFTLMICSGSITPFSRDCCSYNYDNHVTSSSSEVSNSSNSFFKEDRERFSPNYNYFNGTASNVDIGDYVSSSFYYPRQRHYYRFHPLQRQCVSFNYSGPSASIRIFYSNFFTDNDYLVSASYIESAIDCYLFEQDCEYIIELSPYGIIGSTSYSFQMATLTLSTMTNHTKYAIHQIFDSSSNIGYHYETVYFDVDESSYTPIDSQINGYASSTSYDDKIDSTHWFYDPAVYSFTDNRRVVTDTSFCEYSSIAYAEGSILFNSQTYGCIYNLTERFSGTFVTENIVLSCAHTIFAHEGNSTPKYTGMCTNIHFGPGINNYSYDDDYGTYKVTNVYAAISYVLAFYEYNYYTSTCASYDWSICVTTNIETGTKTHSCMGMSGFSSYIFTPWSYARCAGYPAMQSNPSDSGLYQKTLWVSYPLENNVFSVGYLVTSSVITISKGNSGGPLYYKYSTVVNGYPTTIVYIVGIVSGINISQDYSSYISYFCKDRALIINIMKSILNYYY